DRLVVRTDDRGRLTDSVETALKLAEGLVEVFNADTGTVETFSEKYGCPVCGISMPELEPRHFSFNSPFGACPTCGGLGTRRRVSEELVPGDPRISVAEVFVLPCGEPSGYLRKVVLPTLARQFKFDLNAPWGDLPASVRDALLYGDGSSGKKKKGDTTWEGIIANVERRYEESDSDMVRMELEAYMLAVPCAACNGHRLKPESLAVTIDGRNIGELTDMSIVQSRSFFENVPIKDENHLIGLDPEIAA